MKNETLLTVLPGASDLERLVVVLVKTSEGESQISLRQQTWAENIGWYDQKSLELAPHQLRQLRTWGNSARPELKRQRDETPALLAFPGLDRVESA